MKDIVAIGEVLIDLTQKGVDELGVGQYASNPGGAPANLAVAAARLEASTAFVGKVGDTNGAGDTFFGAALSRLVHEDLNKLTMERLTEIASFANKAASITTSRHGAIPAMPRLEEVR